MFFFSKYDREVVRVFQIREHHTKIVKLGRYAGKSLFDYTMQGAYISQGSNKNEPTFHESNQSYQGHRQYCQIKNFGSFNRKCMETNVTGVNGSIQSFLVSCTKLILQLDFIWHLLHNTSCKISAESHW